MPIKDTGTATDFREIDRHDGGVGWIAHPGETMQRASHALAADGDVWVVDPVDAPGIDDLLADLGTVAGVVVLLDRHRRDAAALADRHGVAVHVPEWMSGVAGDLDAAVERPGAELADTGWELHSLVDNTLWQEGVLSVPDHDALVVPEAVGTAPYFRAGGERLGIHPMLRLSPPRSLRRFDPERVLVGHGAGVHGDATAALEDAIRNARARAPRAYVEALGDLVFG